LLSNSLDKAEAKGHPKNMPDILTQRSLLWTHEELSFGRLTADYVSQFGWESGTDWNFDEARQEYRCTFQNGRRSISVLFSGGELLAERGRTTPSDGIRQKLDDAMGRQASQFPPSRWLA
jgi:hypothetical protein